MSPTFLAAALVPGLPHVLFPERSVAWEHVARAYEALRKRLSKLQPDCLVVYSSYWISVLGTSFQALPHPRGCRVDENWHEFGGLDYDFPVASDLSELCSAKVSSRALPSRTIAYEGFPIDTGTLVALRFLRGNGEIPVCPLSSWIYASADQSREIGCAVYDASLLAGKRAVFIAVSPLSARYFNHEINANEDHFAVSVDDLENRRVLAALVAADFGRVAEILEAGQPSIPFEVRGNALHWLGGILSKQHLSGEVLGYGPLWGSGAGVVLWENLEESMFLEGKNGSNTKN